MCNTLKAIKKLGIRIVWAKGLRSPVWVEEDSTLILDRSLRDGPADAGVLAEDLSHKILRRGANLGGERVDHV